MTTSVFRDDLLELGAGDRVLAGVLALAGDRGGGQVRPADLIAAVLHACAAIADTALRAALVPGAVPLDLLEAIDIYAPADTSGTVFDGRRERFSGEALAALDRLATVLVDGDRDSVVVRLLLACVLRNLADADRAGLLAILDAERACTRLEWEVEVERTPPQPLLDGPSGRLRSEEFSSAAWHALEQAAVHAGRLGYDRLLAPHCLLALLAESEGPAEHVVRLEGKPAVGPVQVAETIEDGFRLAASAAAPVELDRHGIADGTLAILQAAHRAARLAAVDRIESSTLLVALLDALPQRLRAALEGPGLGLDVARMRRNADAFARVAGATRADAPFRLPPGLLASEDLTYLARSDELQPALHLDRYLEPIQRALCRRDHNHVLITAPGGTGATTLLRELARIAASAAIRSLARKRFLRVDCTCVTPADSADKLAAVLAHVAGRTDVILCLDGLGPLLRGVAGASHAAGLRVTLAAGQAQVVAVMTPHDYRDMLAGEPALRDLFTRIELDEPTSEQASDIAELRAADLEREYGLQIEPAAARRSVTLTTAYLLSQRLPAKAIRVLRRACEDADYARQQERGDPAQVTASDIARVVAELTDMPVDALAGTTARVDYVHELESAVVGQPEAVQAVAAQLRSVTLGITEPGRPAAVMLFAGLTGVGKTELAKALATLYSASRRLRTYTMGNFTEPHSVSGFVGVPPGYVGYESGGRLINDLNADPHCVVLLDEAEKAHPDVWKPFLNLFDEGWIVDQRGTQAFADRAMFVLASNVGHETIARMSRDRKTPEQIAPHVREALASHSHARTGELVFPPELLARIGRIVVFRPLDEKAMRAICAMAVERAAALWRRRDKTLIVAPELREHIATQSHRGDQAARNTEGGRIVRRLIDELIQARVTEAIVADMQRAERATTIEVSMTAAATADGPPQIHVRFAGGDDDDGKADGDDR